MVNRQPAPELEFQAPACPLCGKEVEPEFHSFRCSACKAWWYGDGEFGGWDNEDATQCNWWWLNPYSNVKHRCVLAKGHSTDGVGHTDGVAGWSEVMGNA